MATNLLVSDLNLPFQSSTINGVPLSKLVTPSELTIQEIVKLLSVTGRELFSLMQIADRIREIQVGNLVSFVINRNINFTNVCVGSCKFCNFRVSPGAKTGKIELSMEEIRKRVQEAVEAGATEICMQGGLSPKSSVQYYIDLLELVKSVSPQLHIHAYSPEEIKYLSKKEEVPVEDLLREFKKHGLGSIPGTAAEILVDEIREFIAPRKLSTSEWVDIIQTAHRLGIPSTSTMMYGHVETYQHVAQHLLVLRTLQEETHGITEFVPLPFIHQNTILYKKYGARAGSTGREDTAVYATSRIVLGDVIPHLQSSWVKTGPKFAQLMLLAGVDDLGGTLMEESISKSAGASFGVFLPVNEFVRMIKDSGRIPVQRDTLYNYLKRY